MAQARYERGAASDYFRLEKFVGSAMVGLSDLRVMPQNYEDAPSCLLWQMQLPIV